MPALGLQSQSNNTGIESCFVTSVAIISACVSLNQLAAWFGREPWHFYPTGTLAGSQEVVGLAQDCSRLTGRGWLLGFLPGSCGHHWLMGRGWPSPWPSWLTRSWIFLGSVPGLHGCCWPTFFFFHLYFQVYVHVGLQIPVSPTYYL